MKQSFLIFLMIGLLCLSACNPQISNPTEPTADTPILETAASETTESTTETTVPETSIPETTTPETTAPETTMPETTLPETTAPEAVQLPLPEEAVDFSFLSGAGGWGTYLLVDQDGSFTGEYHDSEMGERDEAYPCGSVYICSFSGAFADIEKVSEYAYQMNLSSLITQHQLGEEWIEDEIRYVASDPYGMEDGTEFILYLPDTPLDPLSEEFLSWWPYRYEQETNPRTTLSCYGILNVAMGYGFFYAE